MRYKCDKCGDTVNSKSNIPLEHGKMGMVVHPNKPHSTKCEGKYIEMTNSELGLYIFKHYS